VCPCHQASFDANGANVRPNNGSTQPLPNLAHYGVSFVGAGPAAKVMVDVDGTPVEATSRALPPPAAEDGGGVDAVTV
jgi:hypothetical protein